MAAMFEDMYSMHGHSSLSVSRSWRALSAAADTGDSVTQIECLAQLSEALALASESDSLGFRSSELCSLLCALVTASPTSDAWLLTLRCVNNLVEAHPQSAQGLSNHTQFVSLLAGQIAEIQFIDVAEAAITCCHKLSAEQPLPLLRAGLLPSLLSHVSFFPLTIQRVVANTAANIVSALPRDTFDIAVESCPTVLTMISETHDEKLNQAWLVFLSRAIQQLHAYPAYCDRLDKLGVTSALIRCCRQYLSEPSLFPDSALRSLLSMIASLAKRSPRAVMSVIEQGGASLLLMVFQQRPQELPALLSLGHELLPALPTTEPATLTSPSPLHRPLLPSTAVTRIKVERRTRSSRKRTLPVENDAATLSTTPTPKRSLRSRRGNDDGKDEMPSTTASSSSCSSPATAPTHNPFAFSLSLSPTIHSPVIEIPMSPLHLSSSPTPVTTPSPLPLPSASLHSSRPTDGSASPMKSLLTASLINAKLGFFQNNPEALTSMLQSLVPLSVAAITDSGDRNVRFKATGCLLKVLHHGSPTTLKELLTPGQSSLIVSSLLDSSDVHLQRAGIQLIEAIANKLPRHHSDSLSREGALEKLSKIAEGKSAAPSPSIPPPRSLSPFASPSDATQVTTMTVQRDAADLIQRRFKSELKASASNRRQSAAQRAMERAESLAQTLHRLTVEMNIPSVNDAETPTKYHSHSSKKRRKHVVKDESQATVAPGDQGAVPIEAWHAQEQSILDCLVAIRACLLESTEKLGLTTHELIRPSLFAALLTFLHPAVREAEPTLAVQSFASPLTGKDQSQTAARLLLDHRRRLFAHVFIGLPIDPFFPESSPLGVNHSDSAPPSGDACLVLMKRLMECLDASDPLNQSAAVSVASHQSLVNAAMSMLTQSFRIQVSFAGETRANRRKQEQAQRELRLKSTGTPSRTVAGAKKLEKSSPPSLRRSRRHTENCAQSTAPNEAENEREQSEPKSAPMKSTSAKRSTAAKKTTTALPKRASRYRSSSLAVARRVMQEAAMSDSESDSDASDDDQLSDLSDDEQQEPPTFHAEVILVDSLATLHSLDVFVRQTSALYKLRQISSEGDAQSADTESPFDRAVSLSQPLQVVWRFQQFGVASQFDPPSEWKLLDKDLTMIELIKRYRDSYTSGVDTSSVHALRELWDRTYCFEFDVVPLPPSASVSAAVRAVESSYDSCSPSSSSSDSSSAPSFSSNPIACLTSMLQKAWRPAAKSEQLITAEHAAQHATLMLLIREIHQLTLHWSTLYFHPSPRLDQAFLAVLASQSLPTEGAFQSVKMIKRAQRDLTNPVDCCCRCYPSWLTTAMQHFSFVFDLPTRSLYLSLTAFTAPRHLLTLHQLLKSNESSAAPSNRASHVSHHQHRLHALQAHQMRATGESLLLDERVSSDSEEERAVPYDDDTSHRSGRMLFLDHQHVADLHTLTLVRGGTEMRRPSLAAASPSPSMSPLLDSSHAAVAVQMPSPNMHGDGTALTLSPIDRVPQIRFRVPRANLLAGSLSLFASQAWKRAQIKIEFDGEEGIGLGPTLEFFTLCSQEIQRAALMLWHDTAARPALSTSTSTSTSTTSSVEASKLTEVEEITPVKANNRGKRKRDEAATSSVHTVRSSPRLSARSVKGESSPDSHANPTMSLSTSDRTSSLIAMLQADPDIPGAARATDFVRFCVLLCPGCRAVEVPRCDIHQQLLTVRGTDGHWKCSGIANINTKLNPFTAIIGDSDAPVTSTTAAVSKKRKRRSAGIGTRRKKRGAKASAVEEAVTETPNQPEPVNVECSCISRQWSAACSHCSPSSSTPARVLDEWCVSRDELEYLSVCETVSDPTPTMAHQCTACLTLVMPVTRAPTTLHKDDGAVIADGSPCLFENRGGQLVCGGRVFQDDEYVHTVRHCAARCDELPMQPVPIIIQRDTLRALHLLCGKSPSMDVTAQIEKIVITPPDLVTDASPAHTPIKPPVKPKRESAAVQSDESPAKSTNEDSKPSGFVTAAQGLFPLAESSLTAQQRRLYTFFGQLVATSLLEGRLLDLTLAIPFMQRLRGDQCTVQDLERVDSEIGRSINKLHAIARKHTFLRIIRGSPSQLCDVDRAVLQLDGCDIDELGLDFAVPGHPEATISSRQQSVTLDNLSDFVRAVSRFLLIDSTNDGLGAIIEGLREVMDLQAFASLGFLDANHLLTGAQNGESVYDFSVATLRSCVKLQGGYTLDTPIIQWLFAYVSVLDREGQQRFVRFVSGTPRLPVGGLRALQPPLSVVKVIGSRAALPTVMTCSHILKLPEFEDAQLLHAKLAMAVHEGQMGFQLS